jgi:hypothetical protein
LQFFKRTPFLLFEGLELRYGGYKRGKNSISAIFSFFSQDDSTTECYLNYVITNRSAANKAICSPFVPVPGMKELSMQFNINSNNLYSLLPVILSVPRFYIVKVCHSCGSLLKIMEVIYFFTIIPFKLGVFIMLSILSSTNVFTSRLVRR